MRGRLIVKTWQSDSGLYAPARFKRAFKYEAFIPDFVADFDESIKAELTSLISRAESAQHQLNDLRSGALAQFEKLLLRSESIASSRVEGLQIKTADLARAEIKIENQIKVGTTSREVIANMQSMQVALAQASTANNFELKDLLAIHSSLMLGSPTPEIAGEIRSVQNWIGKSSYGPLDVDYIPPPPEELSALLNDLVAFINKDNLSPVVQAAIAHAQFELIHPFMDGNGRTGRALIHVIKRRRSMTSAYVAPISIQFLRDRKGYIQGLNDFKNGDVDLWIEYFALAQLRSAKLAQRYLLEIESIQYSWNQLVQDKYSPPTHASIWKIIKVLPEMPVVTVNSLAERLGFSIAVINRSVQQLEQLGILTESSNSKRNRFWQSIEILNIIDEFSDV